MESYLEEPKLPRVGDLNVLEYWKGLQGRFPIVSQMARDILFIPISTVASESVFSVGGRVLDAYRSSQKLLKCLFVLEIGFFRNVSIFYFYCYFMFFSFFYTCFFFQFFTHVSVLFIYFVASLQPEVEDLCKKVVKLNVNDNDDGEKASDISSAQSGL